MLFTYSFAELLFESTRIIWRTPCGNLGIFVSPDSVVNIVVEAVLNTYGSYGVAAKIGVISFVVDTPLASYNFKLSPVCEK